MPTNEITTRLYAIDRKVRAAGMRPLSAQELQALARLWQAHLPTPSGSPAAAPPALPSPAPMTAGLP